MRRPKPRLALSAVAVTVLAVGAWLLWPRAAYRYQGKTVEKCFQEYVVTDFRQDFRRYGPRSALAAPFREMGTNAAPFLANQINQDLSQTRLERWSRKLLPARFWPTPRVSQADAAALFLSAFVQPPEDMLK